MSPIDVDDLVFDDENEAKFASHGLTIEQVQQVFDNRSGRRASHVMLGPTFDALLLVVPLEACGDGLWRPVTAFHPTPAQAQTYRSRR
jgi:hypothetical protein